MENGTQTDTLSEVLDEFNQVLTGKKVTDVSIDWVGEVHYSLGKTRLVCWT